MDFVLLRENDADAVRSMSDMASAIVREHYDPILGSEQNDYMIDLFQSVDGIMRQIREGYRYYFVREEDRNVGFLAVIPHPDCLYLSKLYLYKQERGKGYARKMLDFIVSEARKGGFPSVKLNVNRFNSSVQIYEKMGFRRVGMEKNDIGHGYYMDDFVYELPV